MRPLLAAFLALAWLGGAARAATPDETLRAAYQNVQPVLDSQDDEGSASSPALTDFWKAVDGVLASEGLDALVKSDAPIEIKTLPLNDGSQLVGINLEQLGHLVLLDRRAVLWSSADLCQSTRACFTTHLGLLPAGADGAQRFYVEAEYAQMAGATRGRQLSLRRWHDGKMETFYHTDFATAADAPDGAKVAGEEATITSKGFWSNFSVCGACDGRQQVHRVRITPSGVQDLGLTSLTPKLDTIDELLGRLAANQPTGDIATQQAAAALKSAWHGNIFLSDRPIVSSDAVCMEPEDVPAMTFRFAPDSTRIIAVEPGRCG